MSLLYRKAMDALYLLCVVIAGSALVLISAVIPWAVYTRYVINRAASWPEPMAVLLTIVLTFFGAAACYRLGLHMNVTLAVDILPKAWRRVTDVLVELLMALMALFMAVKGAALVAATWSNTISDFPALSVGVTYLPIPIGGGLFTVVRHRAFDHRASAGSHRRRSRHRRVRLTGRRDSDPWISWCCLVACLPCSRSGCRSPIRSGSPPSRARCGSTCRSKR